MRLFAALVIVFTSLVALQAPAQAAVSYYLPYATDVTAKLNQGPGNHNGNQAVLYAYDLLLPEGSEEVWASAPGVIQHSEWSDTEGHRVMVKHADNTDRKSTRLNSSH